MLGFFNFFKFIIHITYEDFYLEPFIHNLKSCIVIKFVYNLDNKEYIKQFNGVYWTKTHHTFYIYFDEVYTHVTQKDLQQISSPLDNALKKLSLRDIDNSKLTIS